MIIKVCGMREAENIRQVELLGIGMIGFIFYSKSPRYVDEMPGYLPENAKRVGVFVNESKEMVLTLADRFSLDYIQLHGNESPGYCASIKNAGLGVIKAFPIDGIADLRNVDDYEGICDYYLFDTKTHNKHGGTGKQFDWSVLYFYNGKTPFLLSGGINPFSACALKEFQHEALAGYDLNSRFESAPGVKNIGLLSSFLNDLNNK